MELKTFNESIKKKKWFYLSLLGTGIVSLGWLFFGDRSIYHSNIININLPKNDEIPNMVKKITLAGTTAGTGLGIILLRFYKK